MLFFFFLSMGANGCCSFWNVEGRVGGGGLSEAAYSYDDLTTFEILFFHRHFFFSFCCFAMVFLL